MYAMHCGRENEELSRLHLSSSLVAAKAFAQALLHTCVESEELRFQIGGRVVVLYLVSTMPPEFGRFAKREVV